MLTVFDVARHILGTTDGSMSAMKLQKLCYYCQAWTLALEGEPLFNEDFLRWDAGPVCYELFDLHRGLYYVSSGALFGDKGLPPDVEMPVSKDEIIEEVLDNYMEFQGFELSKMTHEEDPWKNTPRNGVITKESMKNYYSTRAKQSNGLVKREIS